MVLIFYIFFNKWDGNIKINLSQPQEKKNSNINVENAMSVTVTKFPQPIQFLWNIKRSHHVKARISLVTVQRNKIELKEIDVLWYKLQNYL